MSSGAPWSVKGIDPRARSRAKSAARREGKTLGEWLNSVILDDSPSADPDTPSWERNLENFPGFGGQATSDSDDALRNVVDRLAERIETSEERSAATMTDVGQSVAALARKLETRHGEFSSDAERTRIAVERAQQSAETLAQRVKSLEEAEPAMSPETVKAFETAFGRLAGRLYETETETEARLDQTEALAKRAAEAAEGATRTLTERLADIERRARSADEGLHATKTRDRRTGEALYGLHGALERLRHRVDAAENLTNDAAGALDDSVARLDARLRAMESRALSNSSSGGDFDRRFDELSDDLARVVAQTRSQLTKELESAASSARVDRLEQTLKAAERRIATAEDGHSQALSRIGEEITRLARVFDDRFRDLERKSDGTVKDARLERDMDRRLDAVRDENKSSVKRISEEVERLGQTLIERVQQSEARSAQAVEAATERLAVSVEQLKDQTPNREDELATRLQQSEERTVARIETALAGVHDRLNAARSETEEALSPVQRAMNALADRLEAIETRSTEAEAEVEAESAPASEPAPPDFDTPLSPPPEAETPPGAADDEADPFIVSEDISAAYSAPQARPERQYSETPQPQARQPQQQARQRRPRPEPEAPTRPAAAEPRRPARIGATADADFLAEARRRTGAQVDHPAYATPQPGGGRGKSLVIAMSVLGFVAIAMAAGVLIYDGMTSGGEPAEAIDTATMESALGPSVDAPTQPALAETNSAAETTPPTSEEAPAEVTTPAADPEIIPETIVDPPVEPVQTASLNDAPPNQLASLDTGQPTRAATIQDAAAAGDPVARYLLGMERLASGDADGAAVLIRRAAEQGVPAAQYRYSKLLERGEGVTADLEAARRWTQQAAEAGHRRAMHNLGIMFATGSGAPQDYAEAARWFEEASLLGLGDSQFNLALLFEQGLGIPQSPGDAYAWYSIAAAGGDSASRTRAATVAASLDPETQAQADAIIAGFTPRPLDAEANGDYAPRAWGQELAGSNPLISRAQSLLTSLGYEPGPVDGQPGPSTRQAVLAFQSENGLSPNGRIDATLIDRLERSTPR